MNEKHLKREGARNLMKTGSGRKYLKNLRKLREIDLLQPDNPKFDKVYGQKTRRDARIRDKQARDASNEWGDKAEKDAWKQKREEQALNTKI